MKTEDVLIILGAAAASTLPTVVAASTPRGVGPEFAKYYTSSDSFTCISAPSIKLSADQINDEFCDCPDGSDEPGTSACAHLSPSSPHQPYHEEGSAGKNTTLALPGFYCANKGHNPSYVPFTYVNDGICDHEVCCDGSDEWAGVGDVKCENKCSEIGRAWRKEQEARTASLNKAVAARKNMVEQAARLKLETQDMIKSLDQEIKGFEKKVADSKRELERVEKTEKARGLQAATESGRTQMLAKEAKQKMDSMSTLMASLMTQRDAYWERLDVLERTLKTLKDEHKPDTTDEGVKKAVEAWEDYEYQAGQQLGDDIQEQNIADFISMNYGINFEEYEKAGANEAEDDVQAIYSLRRYLPESLRAFLDDQLSNLRTLLENNGILKPSPAASSNGTPGTESKALRDARTAVSAAESDLTQRRNARSTQETTLNKDFGPDDVFRPLDGSCVSLDSGEYTYELCWMGEVNQISKKGTGRQNMGRFSGFDKVVVDDEDRPDGKSLGSGERTVLKFEDGNHCWNGPNRSTTVVLACAEKEEVWKVTEEEKCVYRMEAGTPAVCDRSAVGEMKKKQEAAKARDEL